MLARTIQTSGPAVRTARAKRLIVAAIAAVACLTTAPAPASAGGYAEEARSNGRIVESTFNNFSVGGIEDLTVTEHLRTLIADAPATAEIRIALHSIGGTKGAEFKDTIVAAAQRARSIGRTGTVTVIYDGTKMGTSPSVPISLRDELRAAGGTFVECHRNTSSLAGGCLSTGTNTNQHAKYVLISQTQKRKGTIGVGTHSNVVWIGSANITPATGWQAYNDAVTVYEDVDLYAGLKDTFETAKSQSFGGIDYYDHLTNRGYVHGADANVTTWASPEATEPRDLMRERLDDITPAAGCQMGVMQTFFEDERRTLSTRLVELRRGGCAVYVVIGQRSDGSAALGSGVRADLCGAGIPVRSRPNIHNKAVVLYGIYNGSWKKILFTGSHNWTLNALRYNDEILARVGHGSGAIYDAFTQQLFQPAFGTGSTVVC